MTIQQSAKFGDVIGQMFRRHTGIFRKRNRFGSAFRITQQPYRFFTHRVNTLNTRQIGTKLPADHARFRTRHQAIQSVAQRLDLSVNKRFIITREFHDIQAKHLFIRHIGNQFANGVPDNIFPRKVKDFGIDRLDG
ncbi:Uncharacterised protein [Salmonella enterica subsp. enterica serovar Typhi]|nr:Uncharacterised protein [Salmonella enterica subsp. enterica serovar Typhi]CHD41318.1 Uncharacterised protein [Salmonella enterica subsp. enterica serovar Typhi]